MTAPRQIEREGGIACGPKGCRPFSFEAPDLPRGHGPGRCKHFRGIFGRGTAIEKCEAGVSFEDVKIRHEPMPYRDDRYGRTYHAGMSLPCLTGSGHNLAGATCDRAEWPTPEEIAQHEAYTKALVANVSAALAPTPDTP